MTTNIRNFSLQLINDYYVLLKEDEINLETLDRIIKGLQAARNYIAASPLSDKSYLEHIGEVQSSEMAAKAKWFFGDATHPYWNGRSKKPSGDCVYFIEHPLYPTLIKIGHTKSLSRRTKEIAAMGSNLPVQVVAFAKTKNRQLFELSLHLMFSRDRITGEWFRRTGVISFLNYCRMIGQDSA